MGLRATCTRCILPDLFNFLFFFFPFFFFAELCVRARDTLDKGWILIGSADFPAFLPAFDRTDPKRALTFRDYSKRGLKPCVITIFYLSALLNIKEALAGDSSGSDFIYRSGSNR